MDPLFLYGLMIRAVALLPLAGLIPALIGVIVAKSGARMDVFTYRRKLAIFAVLFLACSAAGYGITMAAADPDLAPGAVPTLPVGTYNLVLLVGLVIPAIAYGFLANASAKRFIDMGRSKFLALALGIPLVSIAVIAYLALSLRSKPSEA